MTGASWVDIEAILDFAVSDTTLRARRDEWIDAGVFEALKTEALAAFDRIIGLDLDDVALDGSLHKAPYGGEGTGPNPTDRAKLGWKWSVACGTSRHPDRLGDRRREPQRRPHARTHPRRGRRDAGCSSTSARCTSTAATTRPQCGNGSSTRGIDEFEIQLRGTKVPGVKKQPVRLGLRWIVEATNTWWSNYGQLRRNTDRKPRHRHAALCLATTILIIGKLIDWRDRWSPELSPIRSGPKRKQMLVGISPRTSLTPFRVSPARAAASGR